MTTLTFAAVNCNGPQLATELKVALGIALPIVRYADGSLVVDGQIAGKQAQVQTVIDAHVPDPNWGVPTEQQRLRGVVATLRQWATDAQTEANAWAGQSAAQRDNAMKQTFQRLGTLMDRLADVVQTGGWNS